jgi:heterodisulfide reductase subunit A
MSGERTDHTNIRGSVLIVGGGVGGMQAALDLAEAGYKVHFLQKDSAIGGTMAMLDKTFPTGDCAMCMISPRMVEVARHENIELHTLAEVDAIQGGPGDFTVTVRQQPRYVDPDKCTGCGICEEKCPRKVDSEFNQNLDKRKAIYSVMAQAVPSTRVIDTDNCIYFQRGKCRACEKFCPADAINFEDTEKRYELGVGAVLLSPGLARYDPSVSQEMGYNRWANVMTSVQFERVLSASGPYMGEIKRPGDGRHPRKIAWIQCVGSRDPHSANPWCSSVCCMYATKQAVIAKEHDEGVEPTIFFMDMRAFGKDFDKYVTQARDKYGVRYQRSMISAVYEDAETGDLVLRYADENGVLVDESFGLVVLSVGLEPNADAAEFARTFGIEANEHGFAATSPYSPVETSREGVYVLGTYQGPKDIPETVVQGSAAAGKAMALLGEARGREVESRELPPERDVESEEPRIGVFVCHCGVNIAQTVDVERVVEAVRDLPGVAHAENMLYSCSQDSQERIKQLVQEQGLNRVLVASCTPRTHEPLFQETIRDAGLNKYLFELADIREQCSWCHMGDKERATQKAIGITRMHIAKLRHMRPVQPGAVNVTSHGLVVGGGIAGMTAALSLAEQGFGVHLVEREDRLGGLLRNVRMLLGREDVQEFLARQEERVRGHPNISVHLNAEVTRTDGYVGNFTTTLSNGERFEHGAVILATGGTEYQPQEYGYEESDKVLTQRELENAIAEGSFAPGGHVAMIQCIGSREEPHNYCSRVCCQDALKNALAIKQRWPETHVTILYRDLRSYGLREDFYQKAREAGVLFMHFDLDGKPEADLSGDRISISCHDRILDRDVVMEADHLVLSAGLRPHPEGQKTGDIYKLTRNEDGYFMEAHVKLQPVDFPSEGLFLAGLAHAPKNLDETVGQAEAAAGRAGILLAKEELEVSGLIAKHDSDLCMSCLSCFRICPFDSPYIDEEGRVRHNEVKCTGCGLCAGVCPSKAFQVNNFTDQQIKAMIDEAAESA